MPRVLIVEDDELIAKGLATHLAEAGFDPLWMGKRRGRARATSLRAARRLRPRPDDAAPRRLEADRDRPGRGHRHPDRRRQAPSEVPNMKSLRKRNGPAYRSRPLPFGPGSGSAVRAGPFRRRVSTSRDPRWESGW